MRFYEDIWKTLAIRPVCAQCQAKKSLSERFQSKPFKVKPLWNETTEINHILLWHWLCTFLSCSKRFRKNKKTVKLRSIFVWNVKYNDERLSIKTSKLTLTVSKHPCSSARTVIMSSMHPAETKRSKKNLRYSNGEIHYNRKWTE